MVSNLADKKLKQNIIDTNEFADELNHNAPNYYEGAKPIDDRLKRL